MRKKREYTNLAGYKQARRESMLLLWQNPEYRANQVVAHTGKASPKKGKPGVLLTVEAKQVISKKVSALKFEWWKMRKSSDTRFDFLYDNWQKAVFERDNFTCRECKSDKKKLHAHHIKSWEGYLELRYEVSNGLTLCSSCHRLVEERERRFAIIRIARQVALNVQNLTAAYGIIDNADESLMLDIEESIEELFKVLRISYLIQRAEQDIRVRMNKEA